MTPLGASMIFVMISLILSTLKHMIFAEEEKNRASNIHFSKIFQLTDLPTRKESIFYQSLYEAYYHANIENE